MSYYEVERSKKHIVWRCHMCKAMAVTTIDSTPDKKCGKCRR